MGDKQSGNIGENVAYIPLKWFLPKSGSVVIVRNKYRRQRIVRFIKHPTHEGDQLFFINVFNRRIYTADFVDWRYL